MVPADHEAPGQESEVEDVHMRHSTSREGIGLISLKPGRQSKATEHDRSDDVREVGREALGKKAPHNVSGARRVAAPVLRTGVQAWTPKQ